jgi:drug/metabolite transporter (DMT)-like permease
MHIRTVKSDILLLLTSMIWGFAFVAQRVGMEHVGPFLFNGIRFALGSASLLPLIVLNRRQERGTANTPAGRSSLRQVVVAGGLAGLVLFAGASLQQIGIVSTTAGNAGFITGLYVVLVPILGIALRQTTRFGTWLGAVLAVIGLYWLSVTEHMTIAAGDLYVMLSALFWAGHVHVISRYARRIAPLSLACGQFLVCSVLSLAVGLVFEDNSVAGVAAAAVPILYGGLCSVGIAYTLQIVAQRDAHPAHAAILMSLEAVFAVIGGGLLLAETLSLRGVVGCALMLAGMLLSQFNLTAARLRAVLPGL